ARECALGPCGSRRPSEERVRGTGVASRYLRAPPVRTGITDDPWSCLDGDQGLCGSRCGARLSPSARAVPSARGDTTAFSGVARASDVLSGTGGVAERA